MNDELQFSSAEDIQTSLSCHPVTARILWKRGFRSKSKLKELSELGLEKLPDPSTILNLDRGVARVVDAIKNKEPIFVYGDYDVDGTCGSALLYEFFLQIDFPITVYQPNRFTEGYGVNSEAVEKLIVQGAKVIITVDCGITAVKPALICKHKKTDLIIIDHHKLGAEIPEAYSIINPQQPEDTSGLKTQCGAALAFFFIVAVRTSLRNSGYFDQNNIKEPNLFKFLDLVAVATVADVMDVKGVNRKLIHHGLRVLKESPRFGFKALLDIAKIKEPTAMHCGFVLGPRINAAGRLETALAALKLLTSQNYKEAYEFAHALEILNIERRLTQDQVVEEAKLQASTETLSPFWTNAAKSISNAEFAPWPRALVLSSPDWHEGVVGIVASKIVEEFKRPVFILTKKEDNDSILKGSVRSISKIDIMSALSSPSVSKHLLNFGGHAFAGGVTLKVENLEAFKLALNLHLAQTTDAETYRKEINIDTEVLLHEIDEKLVAELDSLAPFGHGFPEPILKIKDALVADYRILKEKHVKLQLESPVNKNLRCGAIWFNSVEAFQKARLGNSNSSQVSYYATTGWNEWNGNKQMQLKIISVDTSSN